MSRVSKYLGILGLLMALVVGSTTVGDENPLEP
jgi:hypothetical protein